MFWHFPYRNPNWLMLHPTIQQVIHHQVSPLTMLQPLWTKNTYPRGSMDQTQTIPQNHTRKGQTTWPSHYRSPTQGPQQRRPLLQQWDQKLEETHGGRQFPQCHIQDSDIWSLCPPGRMPSCPICPTVQPPAAWTTHVMDCIRLDGPPNQTHPVPCYHPFLDSNHHREWKNTHLYIPAGPDLSTIWEIGCPGYNLFWKKSTQTVTIPRKKRIT